VAPPFDLPTIEADQAAAVRLHFAAQVAPAQNALNNAQSALSGAETELTNDQQTSTNAATDATLDQLALNRGATAEQEADAANSQAQAVLTRDHQRLVAVAVQLYVGDPTEGGATTVSQLEEQGIAEQLAQVAIDHIASTVQSDKLTAAATQRSADQAGAALEHDAVVLAEAQHSAQQAAEAIGPDTARVKVDTNELSAATAAFTKASAAMDAAVAALGQLAPDGSISILGRAALDANQMTAWYNSTSFVDLASTPISKLATWYLSEGSREGVRGDMAFAQSIVETGGFGSPDAITQNNYAGIGHCDSCASGYLFASAQLGIRGQMQLLRTYATPGLTTAELHDPPANADVVPQKDFREGCCASWQALTGTWATSTTYGATILNVYQGMLEYVVSTNTS